VSAEMLSQLVSLTREEFDAFMTSGAFTGFTDQDLAQANETDREKMKLFNEALRLKAVAKRILGRQRNLGQ
jgi:hypothetical protein